MLTSTRSQIIALVIVFLATAFFVIFDTPFIANVIVTVLIVAGGAWIMISVLRGPDELQSAAVRFGLAFGAGIGVPFSLAFVMLMRATPNIQDVITRAAAFSTNDLSPAAVGFAMGVVFVIFVASMCFAAGHSIWWMSKR